MNCTLARRRIPRRSEHPTITSETESSLAEIPRIESNMSSATIYLDVEGSRGIVRVVFVVKLREGAIQSSEGNNTAKNKILLATKKSKE